MVEPIQGEAGVKIPKPHYLNKVKELCHKYNVLFILDEIQTGLGRTGEFMCHDYNKIKPDIVAIGKSLSGGFMPISAVLCNDNIMQHIRPGDHGSTFGGNPLACAIAPTAIKVLFEEGMIQNSKEMGKYFLESMKHVHHPEIKEVRGMGLFCSIEFFQPGSAKLFAKETLKYGLACKDTKDTIVRLAPPLIIKKDQIN